MPIDTEKLNKAVNFEELKSLVAIYHQRLESRDLNTYNEAQTKRNFIEPFFKALGWNIDNKPNLNSYMKMEEGVGNKRVDYEFGISGIPRLYVEAKTIKEENLGSKLEYEKQAINYAWLMSCSWAVLTNFKTLILYNADSPDGMWGFTLNLTGNLDDIKEQLYYLSKQGFEENALDKWAELNGKKPVKVSVDKKLLSDLIKLRGILSSDIQKNNAKLNLNGDQIDEAVQRTLDRIIFIRSAEDRELEPNELQKNYRQWSVKERGHLVNRLRELYKKYKESYNSGLFGEDDSSIHLADRVEISNEALRKVIEGFYSPDGANYSYDFSLISVDVLGKMYEQYLANILKKTPKRAKVSESQTHRKEQGIYYTPSYIVDYIVKNTVGEYIKTHTPEEIEKVRILDPACGSGSFLIRAYQELEDYWNSYYEKNKKIPKSARSIDQSRLDLDSEGLEFYSLKMKILKNNIFGVDLDPKAAEIARLNLLLKISAKRQKLPMLQNNIKVGNSLIDDYDVDNRAFNWKDEFQEIMEGGGFDIVLGNPPYVRSILLKEDPQTWEYYKNHYESAFKEFDIYICFLEKAQQLMTKDGYVGFIMPNKWLHAAMGEKARKMLSTNKYVDNIVNFGSYQIFDGATNYTILLFLRNRENKKIFVRNYVGSLSDNIMALNFDEKDKWQHGFIDYSSINSEPWNLVVGDAQVILSKLSKFPRFGKYYSLAKGTGTDADKVFFVRKLSEDANYYTVHSKLTEKEYRLEKYLLKPSLKGKDITSYRIINRDNLLIFPYDNKTIISETEVKNKSPRLWAYLNDCRETLESREKGKKNRAPFYRYSYPRGHILLSTNKILVPAVANHAEAAWDSVGYHVIDSVYFVKKKGDFDLRDEYILAILNSDLLTYFLMKTSTNLRGGYFTMKTDYVSRFPLKINFETEQERNSYQSIVELVNRIKEMKAKNGTDLEMQQFNGVVNRINDLIFTLYELSEDEVKTVKEAVGHIKYHS